MGTTTRAMTQPILVIDDSPEDYEMMRRAFRTSRVANHFFRCEDGEEALDFLFRRGNYSDPERAPRPGVILLDLNMPGTDGRDVLREIKSDPDLKKIPVVVFTMSMDPRDIEDCYRAGANSYVHKPVGVVGYVEAIERLGNYWCEIVALPMTKRKLLIVEDSPEDRLMYRRLITQQTDHEFEILEADSSDGGLELFRSDKPDCILLDYNLPDANGLGFLAELGGTTDDPACPVVMLTGVGSEQVAVEAMKRGAADYLIKGQINALTLNVAIDHAVERHQLRGELKRSQNRQLEMKDELLSHVSHELRTPLAAAHQFMTLLLDGLVGDLNPEQREYLEIAERNASQLQRMIGDLIASARLQSGKLRFEPQRASTAAITKRVIDTQRAAAVTAGIALSAEVPDDLPLAYADPQLVQQVLVNLIGNAIKFTPEGGSITLRACVDTEDGFLSISLSDTGCGIAPEVAARVFEHLFQSDPSDRSSRKGLGLGLYICREIVQRHGGRIWLDSHPGRGTTFTFTLPRFSMREVLLPVLKYRDEMPTSVALIMVDVVSHTRQSNATREAVLRETRRVVRSCTLPDMDVVLPAIADPELENLLSVLVCADQNGARVLVHRIKEQLSHNRIVGKSGFEPVIVVSELDVAALRGEAPDLLLETVASTAETLETTLIDDRRQKGVTRNDSCSRR